MPTTPIDRRCLLLGEGDDELHVFNKILQSISLDGVFQVEKYGGKDSLRLYLSGLKNRVGFSDLESVIITRDADTDADSAFQSVTDALLFYDFACPAMRGALSGGIPAIGVYIIPGGKIKGMLEDVCLSSVDDDPTIPCVDVFLNCLQEKSIAPSNTSKARAQAFLASRDRPDLRLGEAAEKGYWNLDHAVFDGLKTFLMEAAARP